MILRKDTERIGTGTREARAEHHESNNVFLLEIELPFLGLVQIGPQAMYTAIKSIILAEEYANEAHCKACLLEYWLVSLYPCL